MTVGGLSVYDLFRVIEESIEEHARLVSEARSLLVRVRRDLGDHPAQEELVRKLVRMRSVRGRLLRCLMELRGRRSENTELLRLASTLLEYLLLVGIEGEVEVLKRARLLARRGAKTLGSMNEAIDKDLSEVNRVKDLIAGLLT